MTELKKSNLGHAIAEAMSNLGAEYENPRKKTPKIPLKKSNLGHAYSEALKNLGAEYEKLKANPKQQ